MVPPMLTAKALQHGTAVPGLEANRGRRRKDAPDACKPRPGAAICAAGAFSLVVGSSGAATWTAANDSHGIVGAAPMRLGINLRIQKDESITGSKAVTAMRAAERIGFDSLWFFELDRPHLLRPRSPDPGFGRGRGDRAGRGRHVHPASSLAPSRGTGAPHSHRAAHDRRPAAARRRGRLDARRFRRRRTGLRRPGFARSEKRCR